MSATTGSGWAQLRQKARNFETQTEALFHTYSQYSQAPNIPSEPTSDQQNTESQIRTILDEREALLTKLTTLLESTPSLSSSSLKQSNLTRHREILSNDRREFANLQDALRTARQRANLLSNVRGEISSYRDRAGQAEAEYMLEERGRVDNSNNMADSILAQAYAVNDSFAQQRETLASIQRRITGAAAMVPGVNTLIGKISAKKRRDALILGSFMGVVCLLFLYFM